MTKCQRVADVKELIINQTWVRFTDSDGRVNVGLVKHIDFEANLLLSVQLKGAAKRMPVRCQPSELVIIPRPSDAR